MVVISVINRETSESKELDVKIGLLNTSELIKSLIEEFEEITGVIPIILDSKKFVYCFEYFETFLPFIKQTNLNYKIQEEYKKILVKQYAQQPHTIGMWLGYFEMANFMADECILNIISDIISTSVRQNPSEYDKDIFNLIPAELNNMIAKKFKVRPIEYLVEKYPNKGW